MARTLAEKVWDAHVVRSAEGEPDLLYIDLHLVHEVTSPQAFDGLRMAGRPVRRPEHGADVVAPDPRGRHDAARPHGERRAVGEVGHVHADHRPPPAAGW